MAGGQKISEKNMQRNMERKTAWIRQSKKKAMGQGHLEGD